MLEHFTFQSYTNAVHYGSSKTFKFVTEARMLTTLDIVKDIDIQNRIWVAYKQGPFAMLQASVSWLTSSVAVLQIWYLIHSLQSSR
jgi:hypothetical protein